MTLHDILGYACTAVIAAIVLGYAWGWIKKFWPTSGTSTAGTVITLASDYADQGAVITAAYAIKAIAAKRGDAALAALATQAVTAAMAFDDKPSTPVTP
jgi:hypothetical protein